MFTVGLNFANQTEVGVWFSSVRYDCPKRVKISCIQFSSDQFSILSHLCATLSLEGSNNLLNLNHSSVMVNIDIFWQCYRHCKWPTYCWLKKIQSL